MLDCLMLYRVPCPVFSSALQYRCISLFLSPFSNFLEKRFFPSTFSVLNYFSRYLVDVKVEKNCQIPAITLILARLNDKGPEYAEPIGTPKKSALPISLCDRQQYFAHVCVCVCVRACVRVCIASIAPTSSIIIIIVIFKFVEFWNNKSGTNNTVFIELFTITYCIIICTN